MDTASDAPIAVNEDLRHILLDLNRAKSLPGARANADAAATGAGRAGGPAQRGAANRALDGRAHGVRAKEWGVTRSEQDELAAASHQRMAAAYERGFFGGTWIRPVPWARARPEGHA